MGIVGEGEAEGSAWMERFAPSVLHKISIVPSFSVDGGVMGGMGSCRVCGSGSCRVCGEVGGASSFWRVYWTF